MNYKLGLYEKAMPNTLSLKEKLLETAKAGYDYLEISIDESDEKLARLDWSKQEIASLTQACKEANVPIRSMCLSGHRRYPLGSLKKDTRTKSMDIMEKAIDFATNMEISVIQLAGYDVYYEESNQETKQYFEQGIKKSAEKAKKKNITLAFETMETPFMDTVEKALHWVNRYPDLKIYPDTGNITNAAIIYNNNPIADLKKGHGHIAAIHLKESKPGVYREVPYAQGHVNFEEMIKASLDLGVQMFVAEFWHLGENNWQEILVENNNFLRKYFRAYI